ncbi:hypothetical protein [Nonomuraea rubra]|uniref:hypothetical protein n=1 Tax=Nonomuraea rubra TaxID=46180 RepID=UPI0031F1B15C
MYLQGSRGLQSWHYLCAGGRIHVEGLAVGQLSANVREINADSFARTAGVWVRRRVVFVCFTAALGRECRGHLCGDEIDAL